MYDPCGTQRLEGDEIIKRLAKYLKVSSKQLERGLSYSMLLRCMKCDCVLARCACGTDAMWDKGE